LQRKIHLKKQAKENKSKGLKKKKKYQNIEEEEDISGIPDIPIYGVEKPTWKDLFIVQLFYAPYWSAFWLYSNGRWFYYCKIQGEYLEEFDDDEIARKQSGLSKKEWQALQARQKEKEREEQFSNKNKRLKRYMKNRVIVNYLDD